MQIDYLPAVKPASIHELKTDLTYLEKEEIIAICVRLAKYKKENKELLNYILRESENEDAYISALKQEISEQFASMNTSSVYLAKKSLRKVLRYVDRFVKYSGKKETEIELRIHYCLELKNSGIPISRSVLIQNIYNRQIEKIQKCLELIHEDLRYDFVQIMRDEEL